MAMRRPWLCVVLRRRLAGELRGKLAILFHATATDVRALPSAYLVGGDNLRVGTCTRNFCAFIFLHASVFRHPIVSALAANVIPAHQAFDLVQKRGEFAALFRWLVAIGPELA
jgi:hypothetical protein